MPVMPPDSSLPPGAAVSPGATAPPSTTVSPGAAVSPGADAPPLSDMPPPPPRAEPYPRTDRNVPTRSAKRASYDRDVVHAILDEGYLCHLGFVRDGAPVVLPTLYARSGEQLYVHGSTGSRPIRGAGGDAGLAVCLTVTHVDGLVLAKSAFHHSINYRSVVVHGTAHQVTDPQEIARALDAIVEQAVPGRADDSRRANPKELAATAVVRLDLREVSAKTRTGGPNDEPEDLDLPHWAGVIPVAPAYAAPVPAGSLAPSIPLPGYLAPTAPRGADRKDSAAC